ncbi:hypothetical protein Ccrd_008216 [Cynara cardunculus var. scolymus]|uniref:O-fucosyltransferase family protein n=1 Tax=Cynara cardunculus var. scolymus TaxID=59895 RepID=A0A103XFM8_CYNCS|nr:hypothetical protein Ccrd_008216 [Cynara cardunculus var. scolymus]
MGEAKAWRYSGGVLVLANNNHRKKLKHNQHPKHCCWLWQPAETAAMGKGQRRRISWSVVCGVMLFALGLISLFTGHVASNLEWYSQKLVKHRLWYNKMGGFSHGPIDIWKSKFSKFYYGCSERGPHYAPPVREPLSNGYLLIGASGGLNQQRTGITDAVVVARILNATLVVPELDHHSFWKDDSDFANIFDVNWFISFLAKDVPIVKRVPDKYMRSLEKPPYTMRVPRKSEPQYYVDEVLPILLRRHVVQLTKFDYRLASDLNEELQRLRCRVNYHAFRFTKPLQNLGHKLVMKMRKMSNRFIAVHLRPFYGECSLGDLGRMLAQLLGISELEELECDTRETMGIVVKRIGGAVTLMGPLDGGKEVDQYQAWRTKTLSSSLKPKISGILQPNVACGKLMPLPYCGAAETYLDEYVACRTPAANWLRNWFEPDMLAFSGCYYGGGDKERYELGEIRKRWTTLPEASPDGERKRGKCPLTPYEVGLMLRALGFKNDTCIYVASGEIYGGEETLQPLRELFPNFYTKEMLASEELEPFLPFSSRLAAIDYIVCDESDVFVTNNNGNMAKILAGRRRYMGHKRTIRPNAKKLSALFLQREKMLWTTFSSKVKSAQRGFMGEPDEMKPGRGDFHEYPSSCICKKPFKFSDLDNHRNQTATEVPFNPEAGSGYGRNEEDQGVNSMQGIENADLSHRRRVLL